MKVRVLGMVDGTMVVWFLVVLAIIFFVLWLIFRSRKAEEAPQEGAPDAEDDLKVIEGIGPKLESVLKQAGIKTYRDLAARSVEELQAILDTAGVARISNPQTWAEQAKLAAEGRWEELKQLQETLKGGVRR